MRFQTRICAVICVATAVVTTAFTSALAEGAFAFGQFGNGGWVVGGTTNARTKAEAQNIAMQQCNARGPNCRIRATFTKTCFAYAVQLGLHSAAAWQEHTDLATAQNSALTQCQKYGLPCAVQGSHCDNIDEDEVRIAEEQRRGEEIARQQAARERGLEYQRYIAFSRKCFEDPYAAGDALLACLSALNYGNATAADRAKLVERRDAVSSNLVQLKQKRDYKADHDACMTRFDEARCIRAAESELSGAVEAVMLMINHTIAVAFSYNLGACRQGSALACDRAMYGPAVLLNPLKDEIAEARAKASFVEKTWAFVVPIGEALAKPFIDVWTKVSDSESEPSPQKNAIPTSTLITGFIALLLMLALGFVVFKQRQIAGAPGLLASVSKYFTPQTLSSDKKVAAPPKKKASEALNQSSKLKAKTMSVPSNSGPQPSTAYILNLLMPGAGNVYFGQPVLGTIFILSILLALFMLFLGGSAAMLGVLIIVASIIAAFFTFGLTLLIGLPVGVLFLMMGAGPILAFFIWIFSLVVSELLVHSKVKKLEAPTAA